MWCGASVAAVVRTVEGRMSVLAATAHAPAPDSVT